MGNYSKLISVYFLCFICISIGLIISTYLASNDFVKFNLYYFYTLHFVCVLAIIPFLRQKMVFIMSPSFLTIGYTYVTFILGSWAFFHKMVIWKITLVAYQGWQHTNLAASFIIFCISLVHISYFIVHKPESTKMVVQRISAIKKRILIALAICWFFIFSSIKIDVSMLGGFGDLSVPKTLAALVLILILAQERDRYRFLYYLVILIIFSAFSFDNKRQAVLPIFSIIVLEVINGSSLQLSWKRGIAILSGFVVVIYLILVMSILRGYGEIKTKNFYTALVAVPDYISQRNFLSSFFQNIETTISFYHSHQAIEFIEKDRSLMTHGATLIKFLFVPVPRSLIDKPISIIEAYTGYYSPSDYSQGVSWPINFFSELYWNFGYWGVLLIVPFFTFFDWAYCIMLRMLLSGKILAVLIPLFMYQYFIFFIRGSGLDLYFVYFILSTITAACCFIFPLSLLKSFGKNRMYLNGN